MTDAGTITLLLEKARAGDAEDANRLISVLYRDLQRLAGHRLSAAADSLLQPTALVHEALAKLLRSNTLAKAPNRRYLFGAYARAMREVVAQYARHRSAGKRRCNRENIALEQLEDSFARRGIELLDVSDALQALASVSERQANIVVLRVFGRQTLPEISEELGMSLSTIEREWRAARAWLHERIHANC